VSDDSSFEIKYAAHTATCTFLLDREGICRRIVVAPSSNKRRDAALAASRCIGAQYVASLDASVSGMLTEMPRVGGAMLFARVDDRGRVSLVRTGSVTRFESHRSEDEDPFTEPADKAPSMSVETSAPVITPSVPTPRRSSRPAFSETVPEDVYSEPENDRTQPFQALSPADFRRLRQAQQVAASAAPSTPEMEIPVDDATLDRTAEYKSDARSVERSEKAGGFGNQTPNEMNREARATGSGSSKSVPPPPPPPSAPRKSARTMPDTMRRPTWPSPGNEGSLPPLPTLRQPPVVMPHEEIDAEDDPYATLQRGTHLQAPPSRWDGSSAPPPPKRSEPVLSRPRQPSLPSAHGSEPSRTPRVAAPILPDKVAIRRRSGDR